MPEQNYHLGFTTIFIAKLEIQLHDPSLKQNRMLPLHIGRLV
jgi:hypothetical protein